MTNDWPQIKARLAADAAALAALPQDLDKRAGEDLASDIRAALQRVHELEQERRYHIQSQMMFQKRAEAAEAKLAKVVEILSNPDALDTRWETMRKALTAAKGE